MSENDGIKYSCIFRRARQTNRGGLPSLSRQDIGQRRNCRLHVGGSRDQEPISRDWLHGRPRAVFPSDRNHVPNCKSISQFASASDAGRQIPSQDPFPRRTSRLYRLHRSVKVSLCREVRAAAFTRSSIFLRRTIARYRFILNLRKLRELINGLKMFACVNSRLKFFSATRVVFREPNTLPLYLVSATVSRERIWRKYVSVMRNVRKRPISSSTFEDVSRLCGAEKGCEEARCANAKPSLRILFSASEAETSAAGVLAGIASPEYGSSRRIGSPQPRHGIAVSSRVGTLGSAS